jgi:hypothetical protein
MTLVGVVLVDKKGRTFLLKTGTGGIIIALVVGAAVYFSFESKRINVHDTVSSSIINNAVTLDVNEANLGPTVNGRPMQITVLYRIGSVEKVVRVGSNDKDPVLRLIPDSKDKKQQNGSLTITRAMYGPIPTKMTGYLVLACLLLFIASFSIGPGVCVWLALSELMPTRIRSVGMGIALLINQGVSTSIAAVFLPMVGNYGYSAMFLFWAACTVIYFLTVTFLLPETKGKTLEQVEEYFSGNKNALKQA